MQINTSHNRTYIEWSLGVHISWCAMHMKTHHFMNLYMHKDHSFAKRQIKIHNGGHS